VLNSVFYILSSNYHRKYLSEPHVLWIDNFSKHIARSIPSTDKGVYSSCLWTGVAVFAHPNKTIDNSVKVVNGVVRSAMPDDIFSVRSSVRYNLSYIMNEDENYYDQSLVKKYNINSIPLKVDVKQFPEMSNVVNNPVNGLRYVHPHELIETNIGSNLGLVKILRNMFEQYQMDKPDVCKNYVTINADENIFYRVLKVYIFLSVFFIVVFVCHILTLVYMCYLFVF